MTDPVDRPTLTDEQATAAPTCEHYWAWVSPAGTSRSARICQLCHEPDPKWLDHTVEVNIGCEGTCIDCEFAESGSEHAAALTAEREAHASEVAEREQAERQVRAVESEIGHAEQNGHHLDPGCQGVEPGQRVPAVRIDRIRAALSGVSEPTTEGASE